MRYLLRLFRNALSRKRIDEDALDIGTLSLRADELSWFYLSTNAICSFVHEGKRFYFRECPPIREPREYFLDAVDRFFSMAERSWIDPAHFGQEIPIAIHFDEEVVSAFRGYLERSCKDGSLIKRLSRADELSQAMNFSIWDGQTHEYTEDFFRAFGLEALPLECREIAVCFLWYMRGIAAAYKTQSLVRSRTHSWFSAVRSVATKIVADAVGLGHMIPKTRLCRLELEDGSAMLGVLCEAAKGNRMSDTQVTADASLQRELTDLNILDLICFQPDHGPNNYNVYREGGEYRVCAFDNDNPNTFLPFPFVSRNFCGCSPIVSAKGRYDRPYMDGALLLAVRNLNVALLKKELKPYLNFLQTFALLFRLRVIKKALKKAPRMLEGNMLTGELNGRYGKTYLTIAAEMRGK